MLGRPRLIAYRRLVRTAGSTSIRSRAAPIRQLQSTPSQSSPSDVKPAEDKSATTTSDAGLVSQKGAPVAFPDHVPDYHAETDYRTS
jgi:hypothetical protein